MLIIEKSSSLDFTKEVLLVRAADLLNVHLAESREHKKPILLALSGGSCLDILPYIDDENLGEWITVMVLDERYSKDPAVNNFAQIEQRGFVGIARKRGAKEINTNVNLGESIEQLSSRFNFAIEQWMNENPTGEIVATIGMGPDGHTAGIIPGSINFEQAFDEKKDLWIVDYVANNQYENRVTTTFNFLRKIAWAVLLVMGHEKRPALDRLMNEVGSLSETPARIYRETPGTVNLITNLM